MSLVATARRQSSKEDRVTCCECKEDVRPGGCYMYYFKDSSVLCWPCEMVTVALEDKEW